MSLRESFVKLIERERDPERTQQNLENILTQQLDFGRGVKAVQELTQDPIEHIVKSIPVAELLMYSLAERLPEGFDPYSGDYKLTYAAGFSFSVNGREKKSGFSDSFKFFMDTYMVLGTKDIDRMFFESGIIYERLVGLQRDKFRSKAYKKLREEKGVEFVIDNPEAKAEANKIIDQMLSEHVAGHNLVDGKTIHMEREYLNSLFDDPDSLDASQGSELLFLREGLFQFDPEQGFVLMHPYKKSLEGGCSVKNGAKNS